MKRCLSVKADSLCAPLPASETGIPLIHQDIFVLFIALDALSSFLLSLNFFYFLFYFFL
jgi:hypothetical protein